MQLTGEDKALILEGLGEVYLKRKGAIEWFQGEGLPDDARELQLKCDQIIELQNKVRSS